MSELVQGERFGRLVVIEYAGVKNRHRTVRCRCDCGEEVIVGSMAHLRSGNTKSCGCLKAEEDHKRFLRHGGKGTRLYNIWKNIRQRCNNPSSPDFPLYGGRGIKLCDDWNDYEAFQIWSEANGYASELTIDRINPDGPYCPDNCRWATWKEQRHNQRRCKRR